MSAKAGPSRILGRILACIGLLYVGITLTPIVNWWASALAGKWDDPNGDTLIVLGGSMLDEQLLGESSYWRSVYAIRAYQAGGFRRVIFSGGRAAHPVSRAMRDFVVRSGVPDQVIATETESDSTRQNGLLVARMLKGDPGRKVLMTSDYHMFRAARVFSKAGLAVQPRPIPDAIKRGSGWKGRWPAFLDLCAETAKIAYYYARGWI